MSLYLKYRPQDFKSIVGQKHIVTTLINALKKNVLTHAYLFCGTRGTGKTSTARIVAKSLNCTDLEDGHEPCNKCENCSAILKNHLVDLIEIDAASNRGIDEIRELREKILFAPTQGKCKVYIIDEVHMLTKEAFNALLKTLEEPPEHAYFILATTEAHKIPETIISRCQQFNFRQINKDDMVGRLEEIAKEENIQAEIDALSLVAKMSGGSLRDAIGLFEQMSVDGTIEYTEVISRLGITGHMLIEDFHDAIQKSEAKKAIELIAQVNNQGQNLNQFCGELIAYLREQMIEGINNKTDISKIIQYIDIFSEAKKQINGALIPQLPLEVAVIKACGYSVGEGSSVIQKQAIKVEIKTVEPKEEAKEEAKFEPISTLPPQGQEVKEIRENDVSLADIKQKWKRILENIETPFIRMSFADGEPISLEGEDLHMNFNSSTLMEKVMNPTNQVEVVAAFKKVFGFKLNIKPEVKKITLKPVTKNEDVKATSNEDHSAMNMAKEVFGG